MIVATVPGTALVAVRSIGWVVCVPLVVIKLRESPAARKVQTPRLEL